MGDVVDPWAGFARGEDRDFHDPGQARMDAYRGMIWVYIEIGVWWVAAVLAAGIVLVILSAVAGLVPVAVALFIVLIVFALGVDQATTGWAKAHNARVAAAVERERAMARAAEADDLAWRAPAPHNP